MEDLSNRKVFLIKHRKDVHNSCWICHESFGSEFQLSFHMTIHSNEAQHKSTTLKQKDKLDTHVGIHSDSDSLRSKYDNFDAEDTLQDGSGTTQNAASNIKILSGIETKFQFGNAKLGKTIPSENCEDVSSSQSNTTNNQDLSVYRSTWNEGHTFWLHHSIYPFVISIKTEEDVLF